MIERLKTKIKSRTGASITFALMIFLVCAVASGVIIVAASTASGRFSGMKEMDSRYDVVARAAELLCRTFDQREIKVHYAVSGGDIDRQQDEDNITLNGMTDPYKSIFIDASRKLLLLKTDDVYVIPKDEGESTVAVTDTIQGADGQDYTCVIRETLRNGLLTFDISASGGRTNNGVYTLSLTFASNVKKSAVEIPVTVDDTAVQTGDATVTWALRDIRRR